MTVPGSSSGPTPTPDATYVAAVCLDLDDTICRYCRSRREVLGATFESAGVDPFFDVEDFARWIPRVNGKSALDLREQCFTGIARERDLDPELGLVVGFLQCR